MYKIMPESQYPLKNLSMTEIMSAYSNGEPITGFVECANQDKQELTVRLGEELYARLPFPEVTIYPFRCSKKSNMHLPTNILCLLNKQIRVRITQINGSDILVSRKKNMEHAYKHLLTLDRATLYVTQIIPQSVFGDIGDGLVGKMHISEVSKPHIQNANEYFKQRECIEVVLLAPDSEMRFATSYRQTFKPYSQEDYPIGSKVTCKVGHWLKVADVSKYFMNITPQVTGFMIVNSHLYLDYGTDVECTVIGTNDIGLLLELVKVL